jgi:hypothetical protein
VTLTGEFISDSSINWPKHQSRECGDLRNNGVEVIVLIAVMGIVYPDDTLSMVVTFCVPMVDQGRIISSSATSE